MSWAGLLAAYLGRNKLRTTLTALSLACAFVLFGLLQPLRVVFNEGVQSAPDARLIVAPKHSATDMLPVAHAAAIASLPQVNKVAHITWFGGTYRDGAYFFPQFAVPPQSFLAINPELRLDPDQREAFSQLRTAAIVGRATAERFGWQVGDRIALIPNIWHNRDGGAWPFELVGIFDSANTSLLGDDGFYFNYDYFDEYRAFAHGSVGTFVLDVHNLDDLASTAAAIDALFANSSAETRTQNSGEYALSFARQMGEVGILATLVLGAVFFTLLLVTGHTISRSLDERRAEVAVLRVLGFRRLPIAALLLGEVVTLVVLAAVFGLACAYVIGVQAQVWLPQLAQIGGLVVAPQIVAQGLAIAACIALGLSTAPLVRVLRRSVVPALRAEG
ncbi:MAG: ABC transporter permease [Pseudomonadota bacterium]